MRCLGINFVIVVTRNQLWMDREQLGVTFYHPIGHEVWPPGAVNSHCKMENNNNFTSLQKLRNTQVFICRFQSPVCLYNGSISSTRMTIFLIEYKVQFSNPDFLYNMKNFSLVLRKVRS